jgi:hypothetical protein
MEHKGKRKGNIMSMGRPKRELHEDDRLTPVSMTLNNHHRRILDELAPHIGASSRSSAAAKVLEAVEILIKRGSLTTEQIRSRLCPGFTPRHERVKDPGVGAGVLQGVPPSYPLEDSGASSHE